MDVKSKNFKCWPKNELDKLKKLQLARLILSFAWQKEMFKDFLFNHFFTKIAAQNVIMTAWKLNHIQAHFSVIRELQSGANVINIYGLFLVHKYISVEYAVIHKFAILLTRQLSAVIYVKMSVVDNIGPRAQCYHSLRYIIFIIS